MASAAVYSKAVDSLFVISPIVCVGLFLVSVLEEERPGCFILIVFLLSYGCLFSVSLHLSAMGWSVAVAFPGTKVIKLFSCSTQLSTKFQLLIKTKMLKNKDFVCFQTLMFYLSC